MADPQAPRLISKVEQLMGSDLSIADDLIKELAVKMKYNLVWTPETVPSERNAFWHQVFYRWGTVSGPGQLPQLQARDRRSSTLVGQLSQTLPQTPKKPRKVVGGHSRAPSEASRKARQHFADVFLKPSVNIDTDTVSFIWSDSIGGIINPQFVTLHTCTEVLARTAEILRAIQEDISRVPSARRWLPEHKA
ncbi:hypothetical protein QBC37DRAFT_378178 [Rhypophila decipiens]|uniref:Uncharacterized protein n=1 Tax=Rhypophila decipiens TaxID=261697 RepID=A0AAN7B3V7_9PEZI|nr:hypothetical protein QBC37DRAFT_378178 [Rhypophila decipiens]